MKQHFELTALSTIHIGSGQVLYQGNGFGFQERDKEIIFDKKIHERAPLPVSRGLRPERELRLHLEDGSGRLLLPGSSLKGAMKTLWISEKLHKTPSLGAEAFKEIREEAFRQAGFQGDEDRPRRSFYDAQALEKAVLGGTFAEDPWSRLRFGDASFSEAVAQRISIRNYMFENGFEAWKDKPQHWLLETIAPGSRARLRMDWPWFTPWGQAHAREGGSTPARTRPPGPETLLAACRAASTRLLAAELRFWEGDPAQAQMTDFIEQLYDLQAQLQSCTPHECILRIGYGSGFHAITGRIPWDILTDDRAWAAFFAQLRGRYYPEEVPTPKTRKVAGQQQALGFLKVRWLRE